MTGLTPFSIEDSDYFNRSFKKLAKANRSLVELVAKALDGLTVDQYPINSRKEPLPGKIRLPDDWTFHKLEIRASKGASGQIRLMYLVNASTRTIKLLWIYSHEQFAKRPPDSDIKSALRGALGL